MGNNIQQLFDSVEELQQNASVNATFGEPIVIEDRTVIPVAEVTYGFGLSFGTGSDEESPAESEEGGGGGGGLRARPLAVVEVTEEGVYVEPVVDEEKITIAGVVLIAWIVAWIGGALVMIFGHRK
jgi:uncharacterized spore protein YtfJ